MRGQTEATDQQRLPSGRAAVASATVRDWELKKQTGAALSVGVPSSAWLSPLDDPARRRRVRVLDLDPIGGAPRSIRPIAALGDDAFEPHGAGVAEDRVAVSRGKVLRQLYAAPGVEGSEKITRPLSRRRAIPVLRLLLSGTSQIVPFEARGPVPR